MYVQKEGRKCVGMLICTGECMYSTFTCACSCNVYIPHARCLVLRDFVVGYFIFILFQKYFWNYLAYVMKPFYILVCEDTMVLVNYCKLSFFFSVEALKFV